MTNVSYTGCCIHVVSVNLNTTDNKFTFTLSNGNTIVTDPLSLGSNTDTKAISGVVSGQNLIINMSDGSNFTIDATSLINVYTAGVGVEITTNTISIIALTNSGLGVSIINDGPTHKVKTLTTNNSTIQIESNLTTLDFKIKEPRQYDITANNITTILDKVSSYFRNIIGLTSCFIQLPDITTVPFGLEFHIFAASEIVLETTTGGNEIIPNIAAPYNFDSTALIATLTLNKNQYYILRKYSTSAYIIIKQ